MKHMPILSTLSVLSLVLGLFFTGVWSGAFLITGVMLSVLDLIVIIFHGSRK